MFTRCPKCKTVHPLTAKVLAHARGLVMCGQCGRAFSALSFLFDEFPSGKAHAPTVDKNAGPPIIGKTTRTNRKTDESEVEEVNEPGHLPHRFAWSMAVVLLVLVTIANLGWTFREPLQQNPTVNNWLKNNGWLEVEREGLLTDPGQVQLISRDMHSHPTRTGILVLSLTFVNLAQRSQIFPTLEITLLDGSNQPIAQRRFQPNDYLRNGADIDSGLAADVFLPVLLELGDPGERAVGFEIQFL